MLDPRTHEIIPRILGFYKMGILSSYEHEADKYLLETDYFEGRLKSVGDTPYLDIQFGFRTLNSGELILAVYLPDLIKANDDEKMKWMGFIQKDISFLEDDPRFEMWVRRYLEGDWTIEHGAVSKIKTEIKEINALTVCTVGEVLFKDEECTTLKFPFAENNHRYHDAHSEAYKYLIDGLDKNTIAKIASRLSMSVNLANDRTLKSLERILSPSCHANVFPALDVISQHRRQADHNSRPAAQTFLAFETFNQDMQAVGKALEEVKTELSQILGVTVKSCVTRRELMTGLPNIDESKTVESHYAIHRIKNVVGKKIVRAEYGFGRKVDGIHLSEVIILHFEDGSILSIDTGSNIYSLVNEDDVSGLRPDDLSVDLMLYFVPPVQKN